MSSTADRGRPEPELFLWEAMQSLEAYRAQHGSYADRWDQLDITFALHGYHLDDPDIRPAPGTGAAWRPRGCTWTYVIKNATATTVLIRGVNAPRDFDWEIEPGMEHARKVAPSGIPEPVLFLWDAMRAMKIRHGDDDDCYADRWDGLDIRFAWPSFFPLDHDSWPPRGTKAVWRPRGCAWTYVIKHGSATTFLIQAVNAHGGVDYEIEQGMEDPRKLGSAP
jgi:hypothetical protein